MPTFPAALSNWLTDMPVAHRGLHDKAAGVPENSLAAFRAAAAAGYAMEFDVRLSADGEVMVFHDAKLQRLTGRSGLVSETPAADLRQMHLLATRETIPTLADVLRTVDGRTPLLIEVKNAGNDPVGPLEAGVAAALATYGGAVAVQSFAPAVVEWFHENAPQLPRGQIATRPGGLEELDAAAQHLLADRLEAGYGAPEFVAYDAGYLPSPLTTRAHARGQPVLTWTVRSEAQWQRIRAHADNLIFEHWRPVLHG
jgi:glycerophosphoryl diester phosphodiesterase